VTIATPGVLEIPEIPEISGILEILGSLTIFVIGADIQVYFASIFFFFNQHIFIKEVYLFIQNIAASVVVVALAHDRAIADVVLVLVIARGRETAPAVSLHLLRSTQYWHYWLLVA
jgi:high-affinity K+ transport system ATPase subunit B